MVSKVTEHADACKQTVPKVLQNEHANLVSITDLIWMQISMIWHCAVVAVYA